jgi:hypothetical protein
MRLRPVCRPDDGLGLAQHPLRPDSRLRRNARAGRWIGLTLPFEGVDRDRIAVLEGLTARKRCWAVLTTAEVSQGGIELRPYALLGQGLHLSDFQPMPDLYAKPAGDLAKMLQRLKAGVGLPTSGPQRRTGRRAYSDRLIDGGWDLLLRRAESGRSLPQAAFAGSWRAPNRVAANVFYLFQALPSSRSWPAVGHGPRPYGASCFAIHIGVCNPNGIYRYPRPSENLR